MKIAIDSDSLPASTRIDTWRGMLCDTYLGLDCRLPEDFRSVIEGHAVGRHTFTRITSSRHTVDRSPTLINRDGLELVFFGIPLAGHAVTIQGEREAVLERGTVVVCDSSRPFVTHVVGASDIVWLSVPKQPIAERLRGIEDMVAICFRPKHAVEQIARSFMEGVDAALSRDLHAQDAEHLLGQVLGLLARTIMSDVRWPQRSVHLMRSWSVH